MRLTGVDDTDIMLDINGQPVVDQSGAPQLVNGRDCWMQDIWCEILTEEGELLHEDEEGRMAYGYSLLEFVNATDEISGEIKNRVLEKLTKREYIDESSIEVNVYSFNEEMKIAVSFQQVDTDADLDIDISIDGAEVYVE